MTPQEAKTMICHTLYDGTDERPVDMDFVLPDYYPDIAAVLKCRLKPMIHSRQTEGGRITVDGVAVIQVMYLDEGRQCIRQVEFSQPFTATFPLSELPPEACIETTAMPGYINCRATSSRRLDVHGAFHIKATVTTPAATSFLQDVDGEDLHKRQQHFISTVPAGSAEKSFTVSEVLELGNDKPAAESLIRGETVPVLTECKIMLNKVILKGSLILRHLYVTDAQSGKTEKVEHEIPFSQIVDVNGLQEEWMCDVQLQVAAGDVHITTNQNGEGRLLSVNIKLLATVNCFRNQEAVALTDIYSTRCPLQTEPCSLAAEELCSIHRGRETVRESFALPPDDIAGIVDIWGDAAVVSTSCEEGVCRIKGQLTVYMLTRNSSGEIAYYERPVDVALEYAEAADRMEAALAVLRLDYGINAEKKVELKAELLVTRRCKALHNCHGVAKVTAREEEGFPPPKAALKIYYAQCGESVWEIAKDCHTSMEEVMAENELTADTLTEDRMLLVPIC